MRREELVNYCRQEGITVMGYSPMAKGKRFDDTSINELAKKWEFFLQVKYSRCFAMADPGFLGGGFWGKLANSQELCANLLFCKILPKTVWKWKNLDWGMGHPWRSPLDPPLRWCDFPAVMVYSECIFIEGTRRLTLKWWSGGAFRTVL